MHFPQREVAKNEPDVFTKMLSQDLHRRIGLSAVGALKVPIFDKRDAGGFRTLGVIARAHGDRKRSRFRAPTHGNFLLRPWQLATGR
jgi:hypothetical protein